MKMGGKPLRFDRLAIRPLRDRGSAGLRISHKIGPSGRLELLVWFAELSDAVDVRVMWEDRGDLAGCEPRPDAGLNAALHASFCPELSGLRVHADAPYSMQEVRGSGACKRKYPKGDWMTSPQWFEEVHNPLTALSAVDLVDSDGAGLLITHDGSQQWFRDDHGVRVVLTAYDPWDESRYSGDGWFGCSFRLHPHSKSMTNAERIKSAAEHNAFNASRFDDQAVPVGGGTGGNAAPLALPTSAGMLEVCNAPGVLAHALYRESEKSGENLPAWAGHEMARRSSGACTHPVVVRLVEWNGEPAEVTLKLAGPVAAAAKTNLMGEVGRSVGGGSDTGWLRVEPAMPPAWAKGARIGGKAVSWKQVRFAMRPREIATVMLDIEPARKQWRDLDAKREVWATVHKVK
jgi:alpha-mannosidase